MDCLLLVDLQNDFLPGGALPVPGGDEVVPLANRLQERFELVVVTRDWHPPDHVSFAANHPGRQVGLAVSEALPDEALEAVSARRPADLRGNAHAEARVGQAVQHGRGAEDAAPVVDPLGEHPVYVGLSADALPCGEFQLAHGLNRGYPRSGGLSTAGITA